MSLDPGESQIHILLINIDSLSLSFSRSFFFLFLSQASRSRWEVWRLEFRCVVTDWWLSFPNMFVWTGKQLLATSDLFDGWMPIGQDAHMIWGSRKVESSKKKNQTSQLAKRSHNGVMFVVQGVNCLPQASAYGKIKMWPEKR